MLMNSSMSSYHMSSGIGSSSFSGGLGLARGGGTKIGLSLGAGAGSGIGMGLGGSRLGAGGLGMGLGMGLGLGAGAGAGLGLGAGGLGAGGLGAGGLSMGGAGGLGAGGLSMGGAGALVPSAAFAMGRTVAAGGLSGGSALVTKAPAVVPAILSRADEKNMLSGLNDRFSAYMAKVKSLQQENATLEAKLSQLTGGANVAPESSLATTTEYEAQLDEYRTTLEALTLDTIKLEIELDNIRGAASELNSKYDFEQGVKIQLEVDIEAMRKDIESASGLRIDLDAKHSSLKQELDFVSKTQTEELASLHSKLGTSSTDKSVSMIEVDTDKSFDIASALTKLRMDHEKTVQQHKEEADAYYKLKMDEIQTVSEKNTEAITITKDEIGSCKKGLQSLQLELQALVSTNIALEQNIAEAHALSTSTVADCHAQIASLEAAIETAKAEFRRQSASYRELLDIKLALDIEISTYRKLLEADDLSIPVSSGPESSFLYSSPPDSFSQFQASADGASTADSSASYAGGDSEKKDEESAQEGSSADKDTSRDTPDLGKGQQSESSTHSEADDSES